jgi:hypothetical protein
MKGSKIKKYIISGIMMDNSVSEERTLSRDAMTNTVPKCFYRCGCGENSMNFCHFNAGSAVQHIDELNSVFDGVGFHFMCVCLRLGLSPAYKSNDDYLGMQVG